MPSPCMESSAPQPPKRRSLYRVALLGSIRSDEILPAAELRRRLAWGRKTYSKARAEGLRAIRYGKADYVRGCDLVEFFRHLAERQAQAGAAAGKESPATTRTESNKAT